MRRTSLRGHILFGAVLWSIGLSIAAMTIATILMTEYRWLAVRVHGAAAAHSVLFGIIVAGLLAVGLVQVQRALVPLQFLRERLAAIRSGRAQQIEGWYPSEVQPLVDDLNGLLAHQDHAVRRAIMKAGDLAHGLKTPLAVLMQESERAAAAGRADVSRSIAEQVHRMQRQVEFHLAHARAAASGATPGATASLLDSAEGLARTLRRLHASRGLEIAVSIDPTLGVQAQREDLDEMLGNLMDNACKWTRSRVEVSARREGNAVVVLVDDDGSGVEPGLRGSVLQRGVRADEAAPGSGLGLAIVRDLADVYGGSISLDAAPGGGLRAVLRLPAAG